jgi:hypothetical protein
MKVSSLLATAIFVLIPSARAADATTPVDYTQRNGAFAPGATVPIEKKTLPTADALQNRRVDLPTVDKVPATVGDRRAAIDVTEARPKQVRSNDTRRPEASAPVLNPFNHREAAITTSGDTTKPPMVAKYQDSLTVGNATKVERLPANARGTTARINRFVFRKNPAEPTAALEGATVTPVAGGSPIAK